MNHTVLFVDDNPVILKTVQLAFADQPYVVFLAESGEEGLRIAEKERPGVIVSDLRMPGMNGLEFLRKAKDVYSNWVGMIFSAYADLNSIMEAVNDDYVWRYITKPWADNRELVIAVNNAIQYLEEREARKHAEEIVSRTKHLAGIGQLAAGIAHQFNNINVCIIGYSELGKIKPDLPNDIREYFDIITKSAKRASEIINDLLNFSNYSSKKFTSCDLATVARDAAAMLQKELEEEGVTIQTKLISTPRVDMDYGLIRLLISYLLTNAWQATVAGYEPVVYLETGEREGKIYVSVTDRGCGIPKALITKIFEPFYSTKGVHAKPNSPDATLRGVGLGLSMSHTIAENHGGELIVRSEPGRGTTFTLRLPVPG